MGNTPEFESGILSSNLSPVSKDVGFSLTGKAPHRECGEQGSGPESTSKKECGLV